MVNVDEIRQSLKSTDKRPTLSDKIRKYNVAIKVVLFTLLIIIVLASCSILLTPKKTEGTPQACFKHDVCIDLIVVTEPAAQEIGLSNYTSLPPNTGMLFIFKRAEIQRMWMKDMKFNIDVLWIGKNNRILRIEKNVAPCLPNDCPIYEPNVNALYVLETKPGFAIDTNLFDSDTVEFRDLPEYI